MLKLQNYWNKIENTYCIRPEELINMQSINEKLLRLAVDKTDYYSTDIIIFINSIEEYILKDKIAEIDLYFYNSGIAWDIGSRTIGCIPKNYRAIAKLLVNNNNITLYWSCGNC